MIPENDIQWESKTSSRIVIIVIATLLVIFIEHKVEDKLQSFKILIEMTAIRK